MEKVNDETTCHKRQNLKVKRARCTSDDCAPNWEGPILLVADCMRVAFNARVLNLFHKSVYSSCFVIREKHYIIVDKFERTGIGSSASLI
jgi:hypothetical protein